MLSSDQRMINRQAEIISAHLDSIKRLNDSILKLQAERDHYKRNATFYLKIADLAKEHETIRDIWDQLVITMTMVDPSVKDWKLTPKDTDNPFDRMVGFR